MHKVWSNRKSLLVSIFFLGVPGGSLVKNLSANAGCRFDPWARNIPWRRKWQPTPVFWPRKSHGQRSPDQGSNLCLLQWQVNSLLLRHQGSSLLSIPILLQEWPTVSTTPSPRGSRIIQRPPSLPASLVSPGH